MNVSQLVSSVAAALTSGANAGSVIALSNTNGILPNANGAGITGVVTIPNAPVVPALPPSNTNGGSGTIAGPALANAIGVLPNSDGASAGVGTLPVVNIDTPNGSLKPADASQIIGNPKLPSVDVISNLPG